MICGSKHGLGDQTCCLQKGHEGPCRCKGEPGKGTITYSEWYCDEQGKFKRHKGYTTIYPVNAR